MTLFFYKYLKNKSRVMSLKNLYQSFYSEGVASEHPDIAGQKEFANRADEILARRKRNRAKSKKNAELDAIGRKLYNMNKIGEETDLEEETASGDETLGDWFGKSSGTDPKTGRKVPGWRQIGGPFAGAPCARQEGQTSTPKCGSSKMAANLSDEEEDEAFRRKNKKDPNQPEKSGAAKPTNVATEETILEKKDACYKKVKSRYKVWPSAYASGALVKCRKVGASNWGTTTEETMLEEEMTTAQKQKETRLKKKYDKSGMKQNMIDQYGEEKGTEIYFAKIRKEAMAEEIDYIDAYDYIIEVLVAADYADSYEAAEVMFEHISDEFTATILEEYIEEKARGTRKKTTVHAYDVDETLFGHGKKGKPNVQVHVKDESGKRVKSLSNQEFNTHKLDKGHSYDFSEFQSAKKFSQTASPNKKVIKDIKRKQARGQNVHLITARSKFDKPSEFQGHLKKHGVDVDKSKIHYTGGMKGGDIGKKKVDVANAVAKKSGAKTIHMYDDAAKVHKAFEKEKKEAPATKKIKTHMVAPDKKGEARVRSYQATKTEEMTAYEYWKQFID